ncbi:hypothetical protein [Roseibacillus ishigakijimensis]|uniref:Uncharacterized protein n=1 Tax=Roseibacillus ishigakijimensis TaxID=454146 RepID=A0A934VMJ7_9BACT|nr:hypothetical protein [Roseibacillus ishigakijimensis]MBK1834166.1 hypothetical protein [Roseibacillus ishigakijimensis]
MKNVMYASGWFFSILFGALFLKEMKEKDGPALELESKNRINSTESRSPKGREQKAFVGSKEYFGVSGEEGAIISQTVINEIQKKGPHSSIDYYLSLPYGEKRMMGLTYALVALAKENMKEAINIYESLGSMDRHSMMLKNMFIPSDAQDLERVISGLKYLPSNVKREDVISEIINKSMQFGSSEILLMLDSDHFSLEDKKVVKICYVRSLIVEDPINAVFHVNLLEPGLVNLVSQDLIRNWPAGDLKAAADWITGGPGLSAESEKRALLTLVSRANSENIDEVKSIVANLPPGSSYDEVYGTLVSILYDKDPSMADDWIEQIPNGVGRDKAVVEYFRRTVFADPEKALDDVFARYRKGGVASDVMISSLSEATNVSPESVIEWVSNAGNLEDSVRQDYLGVVNTQWALASYDSYLKKVIDDPNFSGTEDAIDVAIEIFSEDFPSAAANWIVTLHDKN